jgi:hypothetical protein
MSTEGSSPALHEGMRGSPDVTRQRMRLLVGQIRIFEDGLERHEAHQCLRTREGSNLGLFILEYHANHPRDKRLVQQPFNRNFFLDKSLWATIFPDKMLSQGFIRNFFRHNNR